MRAAAVTSLGLALMSCGGKPKCADLQCLFNTLTVKEFDSNGNVGPLLALHAVDFGPLSTVINRDFDGGNSDGLTIAGPGTQTFESSSSAEALALLWTDSLGCRPSFCYSACPKNARCFAGSFCTPVGKDGLHSGVTTHWVEYGSQPATDTDFDLDVTPVSAAGCPADITPLVTALSSQVWAGFPTIIQVHIPGATTGGGGGGGGSIVGVWKGSGTTTQGAATTSQTTTYTFNSDGSETYDSVTSTTYTDGTPSASSNCVAPGSYTTNGGSITIVTPSPPASCGGITSPYTTTWSISGTTLSFGGDPLAYVKQ